MQDGSKKAILAAFFANLGIAIAKFVGFALTRSTGLLAEAGHSLADTGNQALLLLGAKRSKRHPNREFQFGFGRERYFWSFVVALVLFSMGGLFALYEGIQKLSHPHETERLPIAIAILLVAIALETFSLRTAVKEARHIKPRDISWYRFIRTSKQPELSVVLLEDIGAEAGLIIALGGVLAAHFTDEPRWDAAGSIAIGILLVIIAAVLAIETKALLIGESVNDADLESISVALTSDPTVQSILNLRTEHISPDEILVATKLHFRDDLDVRSLSEAINRIESAVRAAVPTARYVFIEPDLPREDPRG
ncbi:MAG: cation diffusion facilitator family transporter [Actinomycetota bacterium]